MFTFAMITGVKNRWLEEKTYGPAARKAWLALTEFINADGDIGNVCEGTNKLNDLQYYLDRKRNTGDLHGQAPLLAGGLKEITAATSKTLAEDDAHARTELKCGTPDAEPGCSVIVRYLYQVLRGLPHEAFFAQGVLGFLLASPNRRSLE